MKINTNFDVVTYTAVVNELVENYFNVSGEYEPHTGMMKSMCTFYNYCVTESEFDDQIRSQDVISAINTLAASNGFIKAYNDAIYPTAFMLDFANAYRDATDIIENRKTGVGYIAEILKGAVDSLIEKFAPALTQENLDNIARIAHGMVDGQNIPQAIVQDYIKSGRFKEVVAQKNPILFPTDK